MELAKPQAMTIRDAVENIEDAFNGDVITFITSPNPSSMIEPVDAPRLDYLLSTFKT